MKKVLGMVLIYGYIGPLVFCYFEETDEVVWGEMYGNVF